MSLAGQELISFCYTCMYNYERELLLNEEFYLHASTLSLTTVLSLVVELQRQ